MKPSSLAARIWLPTLVVGLALVLLATTAWVRTQATQARASAALAAHEERLALTLQWQGHARALVARDETLALAGVPTRDPVQAARDADLLAADRVVQRLRQAGGADGAPRLDGVLRADAAYRAAVGRAAQADAARALLGAFDGLVEQERRAAADLRDGIARDRLRTVAMVAGAMGVVLVLLVLSSALLVRGIRGPLRAIVSQAARIGQGDLRAELPSPRDDEIGEVQRALGRMRDALHGMVADLRGSADGVRGVALDLREANESFEVRSERSLAQLGDAAGTMTELTDAMRATAASSREVAHLADTAAAVAERGGGVVLRVVDTMDGIQSASRRIADIVGVIDGIAFQTNLLALNAAVEAARAGESGRGFAVVAAEVRSLASRTAASAREIKALVGDSVEAVQAGGEHVSEAGRTMAEIMDAVRRVADLLQALDASTDQQARRIAQVHGVVLDVDRLARDDQAAAGRRRHAVTELTAQAARLSEAIARFRTTPAPADPGIADGPGPTDEPIGRGDMPEDTAPAGTRAAPRWAPGQAPSDRWLAAVGSPGVPTAAGRAGPPAARPRPAPPRRSPGGDWVEQAEGLRARVGTAADRSARRHADETGDDGWRAL